jgi:hypothetical protein
MTTVNTKVWMIAKGDSLDDAAAEDAVVSIEHR